MSGPCELQASRWPALHSLLSQPLQNLKETQVLALYVYYKYTIELGLGAHHSSTFGTASILIKARKVNFLAYPSLTLI